MNNVKKHRVVIFLVLAVFVIVSFTLRNDRKNYSLADFGVPPLIKTDCSSVKNDNSNSPITVSFDAPDVSAMRDKIKILIAKYDGHVTSDSFSSYPNSMPDMPSSDSANINVTFDQPQNEFLTELSGTVKNSGGVDTGYDYNDGSQPQYYDYSPFTSCIDMMQSVRADILQLEVFMKALKKERNPANVSILSQSISNTKTTLQSDVNSVNNFFTTSSDKPSVSISINTLQK